MATRRENGAGTKPKKDEKTGLWNIRISYKDKLGNPKIKAVYGKTMNECKEKRETFIKQIQSGIDVDTSKIALGEWLDKWLEAYKRPQLEVTSYSVYKHQIDYHIKPELKNQPLAKLQRVRLQEFFNQKLAEGLSPATLKLMRTILADALKTAVLDNLILRSPAYGLKLPSIKNIKAIQPLSSEQIKALLEAAKGTEMYTLIYLGVYTGMRRGELCGLRWQDVSFRENTIHIQQGAKHDREQKKDVVGAVKTGLSNRIIPVGAQVIVELKKHKAQQAKVKLELGDGYNNQDLVFARVDGNITSLSAIYNKFSRIVKRAGLSGISMHDLRHTFASIAISRKANIKALSAYLGHAKIDITLDRYGHLMPGDKDEVVHIVQAYIAGE